MIPRTLTYIMMLACFAVIGSSCSNENSSNPEIFAEPPFPNNEDLSSSSIEPGPSLPIIELVSSSSEWVMSSSSVFLESSSSIELVSSSSEGTSSSSVVPREENSSSSVNVERSSSSMELSSSSQKLMSSSSVELSSSSQVLESSSSKIESSSSAMVPSSSSNEESSSSEMISSSSEPKSSSSVYNKASWTYLNNSISYDTIIDSRDNQVYKIVTIGKQTWMAENLNYADSIQTPSLKEHSWCPNKIASNCAKFGRLYNLYAIFDYDPVNISYFDDFYEANVDSTHFKGLCPSGWRMPERSDFTILTRKYGVSALKSKYWSGSNTTGFSMMNAGLQCPDSYGFSNKATYFALTNPHTHLGSTSVVGFDNKGETTVVAIEDICGISVRCIKDSD